MTGPMTAPAVESPTSTADRRRRSLPAGPARLALGALGLLVLLSVVRVVSGADEITSPGTVGAALGLAVPIGLAGLGGLWAERAGIVNIGLEGMLILGTWFGAYVGTVADSPWLGVLAGAGAGAVGGLLHAVATVTFGVDHVVSGVAINLLGAGVTQYLSSVFYGDGQVMGAGPTQSALVDPLPSVSLPLLSGGPDLLGDLDRADLFLLSDAAGVLRGLTADVSVLTLLAVALVPLTFVVLWRTAFGLRLRSVGENPVAADSLGVPVYRMKYAAVVTSGALAGLGGAVIVIGSIYREGQTGGRGFIGLATVIFGNWRPGGLAAGAGVFGYADAVQSRAGSAVRALLLLVALVLVLVAVAQLVRRHLARSGLALALALVFGSTYAGVEDVPSQLVGFTPHLITLLVLAAASQRLRPPAADGLPYRRGQQT